MVRGLKRKVVSDAQFFAAAGEACDTGRGLITGAGKAYDSGRGLITGAGKAYDSGLG